MLLVFVLVLIAVLWVCQIGLLDHTYRTIRTKQVSKITSNLADQLESKDINDITIPDSFENNVAIVVIDKKTGYYYYSNQNMLAMILGRDTRYKISELINLSETGDSNVYYITNNRRSDIFEEHDTTFTTENSNQISGIVYLTTITNDEGSELIVMGLGEITPVFATVGTLRTQLMNITIVLVALSIGLSYYVARYISKPLENLTENAKKLATGNFETEFHGTGFDEIEELTDTLNFTAQELKKSDQLTKDLIANVSHDLRTPLTMISGYGELIRDVPGEATPENIQVIIDEANRLTSLVNYMLDISKLQSGTTEITKTAINANELLLKVANTYNTFMESNGYHFNVEGVEEAVYINADRNRIEQVLHNLISNAITHIGEDKTVILKCTLKEKKVRFDVIDHGSGIKEEDLPLIWQRYYKVDKKLQTGSGLGLSIVKTIMELHEANYGVNSKIGEGTDFWFELPAMEDNDR